MRQSLRPRRHRKSSSRLFGRGSRFERFLRSQNFFQEDKTKTGTGNNGKAKAEGKKKVRYRVQSAEGFDGGQRFLLRLEVEKSVQP